MSKLKITGPWDMQKIESYLDTCVVPLKLAIISARGWPVIASLWFFYEHGVIYCASKEKSKVVQLLKKTISVHSKSLLMHHHIMGLGDKVWLLCVMTLAGKRWKIYTTAF